MIQVTLSDTLQLHVIGHGSNTVDGGQCCHTISSGLSALCLLYYPGLIRKNSIMLKEGRDDDTLLQFPSFVGELNGFLHTCLLLAFRYPDEVSVNVQFGEFKEGMSSKD